MGGKKEDANELINGRAKAQPADLQRKFPIMNAILRLVSCLAREEKVN